MSARRSLFVRASAQGECQCKISSHLHSITWAGAHATHKATQFHRDAVEGPSLRPSANSTIVIGKHTYLTPGEKHSERFRDLQPQPQHRQYFRIVLASNFPRLSAGVEHNTYIGDTLSLLLPLQRYDIYDLRRVHTSIPLRYESSTLSYTFVQYHSL